MRKEGPVGIVIALTDNKCDLSSKREVPEEEARNFAQISSVEFLETSAKTGFNVDELFSLIARKLPQDSKDLTSSISTLPGFLVSNDANAVSLGNSNSEQTERGCC